MILFESAKNSCEKIRQTEVLKRRKPALITKRLSEAIEIISFSPGFSLGFDIITALRAEISPFTRWDYKMNAATGNVVEGLIRK